MALQALRAGLSVRIIDKAQGRSPFSKAIGLQYRVSEILAHLGLAEKFVSAGARPAHVRMHANGRLLLTMSFFDFSSLAGRGAFAPTAIMLPQSETERLLADAVNERGGRIEWATELAGLSQGHSGVRALVKRVDGSTMTLAANWLVGCDGAHSTVRKLLGLTFEGKSLPVSFMIFDIDSAWPADRESVHVWFHRDGSAAAMPLPGTRRWRLFLETTGQSASRPLSFEDAAPAFCERAGAHNLDLGQCLWQSEFRINCRMVDRVRVERVFLAGDAAHIHSPTGGQGIATGLQDVTNLAWKLGQVQRGAPMHLLDTYARERLPEIRRVLDETDRNTNVFVAPRFALRMLRDYAIVPLLRRQAVQKRLVRRLSQLDVSYRGSELSQHTDAEWWRGPTRVRAGDRAPDVAFVRVADGGSLSIFSLLQRGSPVAILGAGTTPDATVSTMVAALQQLRISVAALVDCNECAVALPCWCVTDPQGEFARLYGMTGCYVCIIRPDGHVGLFQRPIRPRRVRNWLARVYGSGALSTVYLGPDGH
jgi:2-polyprenyl-6-methoxyphenol hydroxylase-like FAD-dependent oxidoreductase